MRRVDVLLDLTMQCVILELNLRGGNAHGESKGMVPKGACFRRIFHNYFIFLEPACGFRRLRRSEVFRLEFTSRKTHGRSRMVERFF